jgi:hypothetical protein
MLANGQCSATGIDNSDCLPVVKLFTPDGACTWLLTELDGRWCTSGAEFEMTPNPCRYVMTLIRRTESGRPAASIQLSTATPMAAYVC